MLLFGVCFVLYISTTFQINEVFVHNNVTACVIFISNEIKYFDK